MNLIIPMAGRGSRFAGTDYKVPKPLISVAGKPMLYWAFQSLDGIPRSRVIVIALQEHEEYNVTKTIRDIISDADVILLPDVTEGQLCTVLAARDLFNNDQGVLIASADTYVTSSLGKDIVNHSPETHGIISVADMPGDHWSFARVDRSGCVVEVAEKTRISDYASTGLYYFSSGKELLDVSDEMICNHLKTRGEYYVIPVYQRYIQRDWRVNISIASEMHDMGTPNSLLLFENYLKSRGMK